MDWNDLRYILTISRAGTLAAAARRLGVNQTTVARRLAAAEAALGTRLFERVDGALYPTERGEAAVSRAMQVEQEVQALQQGIGGADADASGLVRITAVPVLVNRLLVPALPQLYARHPRLRIELVAEPRNLSLTRREADIALRMARPESGGGSILAKRLGRLEYAAYGPRRRAADRLAWITYEEGLNHLPQARWIAKANHGADPVPLSVSDTETIVHAVRAGLGKSLLPRFAADRDARLRCLSGPEPLLTRELWLLTHGELRHHARIAAVVTWLEELVQPLCNARTQA
ncbi:MAG: LysR family transcriptional regulator [Parvibaculaceae bacterium]